MSELDERRKTNIDLMSIGELYSHINDGSSSIYQGNSYSYIKTRLLELEAEEDDKQRRIDRNDRDMLIKIAEEANELSHRANRTSSFAIGMAVFSLLFAIAALFYCTL